MNFNLSIIKIDDSFDLLGDVGQRSRKTSEINVPELLGIFGLSGENGNLEVLFNVKLNVKLVELEHIRISV